MDGTEMVGTSYDKLPRCADILTDIVASYSAAAPFIPVKVRLCLSEDDDRGHILERSSM